MKVLIIVMSLQLLCLSGNSQVVKHKYNTGFTAIKNFQLSNNNDKKEEIIPRNFYAANLGFFCRQEIKMQKVHVPVTFRLGSMEFCNRMEGKVGIGR